MINLNQKIYGYRRDNNRVGIRNYVVILPVDDISNAACEAVAITSKEQLPFRIHTEDFSLVKILIFILEL